MTRAAAVLVGLCALTAASCSGSGTASSPTGHGAPGPTVVGPPATGVVASADPRAAQITDVVTKAIPELQLQSVLFAVWDGDKEIVKGAIAAPPAQPPTAADARVRVGQPMEAMLGTVLLQLAAEGKVKLDD